MAQRNPAARSRAVKRATGASELTSAEIRRAMALVGKLRHELELLVDDHAVKRDGVEPGNLPQLPVGLVKALRTYVLAVGQLARDARESAGAVYEAVQANDTASLQANLVNTISTLIEKLPMGERITLFEQCGLMATGDGAVN